MSKGLEALDRIKKAHYIAMACMGIDKPDIETEKAIDTIEYELNALEIIKNKKVNLFHIWVFDDYEQYKEHYPFSEYHAEEDMLTNKEFDLLKEVLENE